MALVLGGSLEDAALAVALAIGVECTASVRLETEWVPGPDLALVVTIVGDLATVAVGD